MKMIVNLIVEVENEEDGEKLMDSATELLTLCKGVTAVAGTMTPDNAPAGTGAAMTALGDSLLKELQRDGDRGGFK